jgi:hypothetical protein
VSRILVRALLVILGAAALLPGVTRSSADAAPLAEVHDVTVPVVFDGRRLEADDFNSMRRTLRGITLYYTIANESGLLHVFTTRDAIRQFVSAQHAFKPGGRHGTAAPLALDGCPGYSHPTISHFFTGYTCTGTDLQLNPTNAVSNLAGLGIDNAISSMTCAYDGTYTTECVLFEFANYGGAQFWLQYNHYVSDLSAYGWDDVASSIIVYGQPT